MELSDVIKSENIKLHMNARTKQDALIELIDMLHENNCLSDKEAFLEDVNKRESEGVTGIGNGIAIPHGKSFSVKETSLAFGQVDEPIFWESIDDELVKFIVIFAVQDGDSGLHLKLLSTIAGKLASNDICKALTEVKSKEEVIEIFSR